MVDYHVHPDFSHDATGSVAEYCAAAVEKGLSEICFTTHYEPDPMRAHLEWVRVEGISRVVVSDWVGAYLRAIDECRDKFPNLVVLSGVEVGFEPGLEGVIGEFLRKHEFDFVLGSVHCLDHVCLTAHGELDGFRSRFSAEGGDGVARRYFANVQAAAESRLFDCLAHLDVYRKYILRMFDEGFAKAAVEVARPVLERVAASGTGIEVNTAPLRKGKSEPYPTRRLLRLVRDCGVSVFTTGSDAHSVADVGSDLAEAERRLRELGLEPARFRQRKRV